jgi:nitroreductase
MKFDEVFRKRKMIRDYETDRQVLHYISSKLIQNAQSAPSGRHTQIQEFIIVKDHLTKSKLGDAALGQNHVHDAAELIIVCSNTSRSVGRYGKRASDFYSIVDDVYASMSMLLTSVSQGIGTCSVGAFEDDKVSEFLNLPKHVKPICLITLGYPAERTRKDERIDLTKLVYYEREVTLSKGNQFSLISICE